MKTPLYITLSFCLLLVASCKKRALPSEDDTTGTPVFYAQCEINGLPVKLNAGASDYYMNSSYYQDSATNVYVYKAELKQKNCNGTCGYGLTILINNSEVSAPGAGMNVNDGIKVGTYLFNGNNLPPLGYLAKFTPVNPSGTKEAYKWTFNDGEVQNTYQAVRTLDPALYSVTLDYSNASCSASHLNVFDVGNPLQTSVAVSKVIGANILTYNFYANPAATSNGPYQYAWDFGDNTVISNEANPNHAYDNNGRYRVKLTLTDSKNNTCTSYYQLSTDDHDCSADYTALITPIQNTAALSAVTVLITDGSGKASSSKDYVQPAASSFEIVSVEDYKDNDQGQSTKKITIKFNCTLNNSGGPLVIRNGLAVIAVAYK